MVSFLVYVEERAGQSDSNCGVRSEFMITLVGRVSGNPQGS